jgi:hypothetical protein
MPYDGGGIHWKPGMDGSDADTQYRANLFANLHHKVWRHRDGTTTDLNGLTGDGVGRAMAACALLDEIEATGGS